MCNPVLGKVHIKDPLLPVGNSSPRSFLSGHLLYVPHHNRKSNVLKEGNVLLNNAHNTFYLPLYGVKHMVKDHSDSERKPTAATRATLCLASRVLLYAPYHRQNSTYHSLCYTSRGALAGTRNSSMDPP